MEFKVGDSIGIYGSNDPVLVARLLEAFGASGNETVIDPRSQQPMSLSGFLLHRANLSRLDSAFVQALGGPYEDKQFLAAHDPLDALRLFPGASYQELLPHFAPLLPRFYSVASSPALHPEEVHLTVSLSEYEHRGEKRYGVASHFLCHLAEIGKTPVPSYVQPTAHFTLPQGDAPIIMIGPGTGVAPFRGFLQERLARQSQGRNWLFFGERSRATDFFYEEFWTPLAASEKLRLDLAFSRDQEEKIYVQHRMLQNGQDLWRWIQEGAHFYVCGEADPMAKDVEAALRTILQTQGNLSEQEAHGYIKSMRKEKRYLIDVY